MSMLSEIHSPEDVRRLSYAECEELAKEIREEILHVVSKRGGHLSSNLGAVEMTIALHRAFDTPRDKIIFDVGHQTYTHKLLTGREKLFYTLRTHNGLCGFPRRTESEYDIFDTGHASTSVSAALGMARARDLLGEKYHVVAVIGDGATTGGLCYEALNDCGSRRTRLIVVVNDNGMSIAKNVGALSKYFSRLRMNSAYIVTKKHVQKSLEHVPLVGKPIYQVFHYVKTFLKRIFIGEGFFSTLGFHYLGPIDGHDQKKLEKAFQKAKQMEEPVLVHVLTTKGNGYPYAEEEPEKYHGIAAFDTQKGKISHPSRLSNGESVNHRLIELSKRNEKICVLTAAMPSGTSTELFKEEYPKRFFDVGIAEEHAVTMCAGLANAGMTPVLFIYSTFLQRGYDQIVHDVCMQGLHVVFMLDRSGFADDDGKTHHGIFDIAYLRHIPAMQLLAPASTQELMEMTETAISMQGPVAIRYPKVFSEEIEASEHFCFGHWSTLCDGNDAVVLAVGSMVTECLRAVNELSGCCIRLINASTVKPLDENCLWEIARMKVPVWTVEEHARLCGFGSSVLEWCEQHSVSMEVHMMGVEDDWIQHGKHSELLVDAHLDRSSIKENIMKRLRSKHG